jgi:Zn-finger nucleic acid-binding protein
LEVMSDPSSPYRGPGAREPDEPPPDPARPWLLQTWLSRRACPVCAVALYAARKEGFRVDGCGQCGGVWLAHEDADRTFFERHLAPLELAEMAARHAAPPPATPCPRPCPDCRQELARLTALGGVVVDRCEADGVWFDADELGLVLDAYVLHHGPKSTPPEVDEAIKNMAALTQLRDAALARRYPY